MVRVAHNVWNEVRTDLLECLACGHVGTLDEIDAHECPVIVPDPEDD